MSIDADAEHFGQPSEPGAPGHQAWLKQQREEVIPFPSPAALQSYRPTPIPAPAVSPFPNRLDE